MGLAAWEWRQVEQQAERDMAAWVLRAERVGLARAGEVTAAIAVVVGLGETGRQTGCGEATDRLKAAGMISSALEACDADRRVSHVLECWHEWVVGARTVRRRKEAEQVQTGSTQVKCSRRQFRRRKRARERALARSRLVGMSWQLMGGALGQWKWEVRRRNRMAEGCGRRLWWQ